MVVIQLLQKINRNQQIIEELNSNLGRQKYKFLIGKYQLVGQLGQGAFGQVYKAKHVESQRPAAVKVINIEKLMRKHPSEQIQQKLRRYLQTQELLMKKCHSAFVVKLYEAYENTKCKVLIMEYCRNGGLDNFISERWALEEEDAVEILRQIMLGLAELHRNNIIHRDLKPANILIHNGIFKIADFGFSKEIPNGDLEQQATVLGSANTMAPQVKGTSIYGLKADIWSLGMIFFMMIYEKVPMNERHLKAIGTVYNKENFEFKTVSGKYISEQSADFLKRTLVKQTNLRMNWEQTLDHPLFGTHFERMPSVYLPGLNNAFQGLKLKDKKINVNQALQLQKELIDFEKLKSQSKKLLEQSRKLSEQELHWELDIELLNRQYLQCRISEFIYYEIALPLQKKEFLSKDNRFHVEFIFLLLSRCRENIIQAKEVVSNKYPIEIAEQFCKQVSELQAIIFKRFNEEIQILKEIEDKFSSMLQDKISKLFDTNSYKQKQKYMTMFERTDFMKDEQIRFTCQKYLLKIVNEIKGMKKDQIRMKRLIKSYKQINQIKLQDLAQKRIQQRIDEILANNQ